MTIYEYQYRKDQVSASYKNTLDTWNKVAELLCFCEGKEVAYCIDKVKELLSKEIPKALQVIDHNEQRLLQIAVHSIALVCLMNFDKQYMFTSGDKNES